MYNCKFIDDNGNVFVLGADNNIVFDIDGLSGVSVNLGKSQGFSQVGETVENQSVVGQTLKIKGVIYDKIAETKKALRNAFAAFKSGKLIFNDDAYIYAFVKSTPAISPIKTNGAFTFQLFAPFPFFKAVENSTFYIGDIRPMFRFPINYETPHIFGLKSDARYVNVVNDGDLKTSFKIEITTETQSENVTLTNLETLKFLKINGTLLMGEKITIYRDDRNVLKVELTKDGKTTDILSRLDDDSDLFELETGDNLILANDDSGGDKLTVQVTFNKIIGAVYEY